MSTCPQCGSAEPDTAQWCGKCYLPFTPSPAVQPFTGVVLPGGPPPASAPSPQVVPAPSPALVPPPAPVVPQPVAVAAAPPYAAPLAPTPAPPSAPAVEFTAWGPPGGSPAFVGAALPPPAWGAAPPLERSGWAPPAAPPPWLSPPGSPATADPVAEGRLLSGRALAIVGISIALGAAYQGAVRLMEHNPHVSLDSIVQWNIVLNVALYAIVATLIISQITPKVRLRWGAGSPVVRVAVGAVIGVGGGGLLLAAVSSASGHLAPDPRIVQIMSSGDLSHILVAVGLACVAAPLVEETLFRGLLLESLRPYNQGMAIIVSAMCFAVWHLNSRALIYYTLMGATFGAIYVKRGLVSSMCAHAGFNGVLTVAAIVVVLGPSHTYDVGAIRVTAPAGWTLHAGSNLPNGSFGGSGRTLALDGPDATGAAVFDMGPQVRPFNPDDVASRLQQLNVPLPAGSSYDARSVREVSLPTVGTAVEMDFSVHSSGGELVFFTYGGDAYMMLAVTGQDAKAQSDFTKMLNTLRPVPGTAPVS